jgi:glucosamine--fructose-6-phosphate aminotransferase (isomerizing)
MCGIVGFTGARAAAPLLLEGLKRLEYRGYDSAGIAVMGDGGNPVEKVGGKVEKLCEKTADGAAVPAHGHRHTRWATHGAPTDLTRTPHLSNDGRFAVVHNGIIENYAALREELTAKGYRFRSETDTEVIVHLLEMYDSGDLKATVMRSVARLEGSYALGVLCADRPDTLFAVREASPLILGVGVGENYFASDVTASSLHEKNQVLPRRRGVCGADAVGVTVNDCSGGSSTARFPRHLGLRRGEGRLRALHAKEIMVKPAAVRASIARASARRGASRRFVLSARRSCAVQQDRRHRLRQRY